MWDKSVNINNASTTGGGTVGLTSGRQFVVKFHERILKSLKRISDSDKISDKVACLKASLNIETLTITVDSVEPSNINNNCINNNSNNTHYINYLLSSNASCLGEFFIPCQIEPCSEQSHNDEYLNSMMMLFNDNANNISNALKNYLKSSNNNNNNNNNACTMHAELIHPDNSFNLTPINPIEFFPTALLKSFMGPQNVGAVRRESKSGFLVLDDKQRLNLLLSLDNVMINSKSPLAGIWINGVDTYDDPYVWACLFRYVYIVNCPKASDGNNSNVKNISGLSNSNRNFLVVFFPPLQNNPEFCRCSYSNDHPNFTLIAGQETVTIDYLTTGKDHTMKLSSNKVAIRRFDAFVNVLNQMKPSVPCQSNLASTRPLANPPTNQNQNNESCNLNVDDSFVRNELLIQRNMVFGNYDESLIALPAVKEDVTRPPQQQTQFLQHQQLNFPQQPQLRRQLDQLQPPQQSYVVPSKPGTSQHPSTASNEQQTSAAQNFQQQQLQLHQQQFNNKPLNQTSKKQIAAKRQQQQQQNNSQSSTPPPSRPSTFRQTPQFGDSSQPTNDSPRTTTQKLPSKSAKNLQQSKPKTTAKLHCTDRAQQQLQQEQATLEQSSSSPDSGVNMPEFNYKSQPDFQQQQHFQQQQLFMLQQQQLVSLQQQQSHPQNFPTFTNPPNPRDYKKQVSSDSNASKETDQIQIIPNYLQQFPTQQQHFLSPSQHQQHVAVASNTTFAPTAATLQQHPQFLATSPQQLLAAVTDLQVTAAQQQMNLLATTQQQQNLLLATPQQNQLLTTQQQQQQLTPVQQQLPQQTTPQQIVFTQQPQQLQLTPQQQQQLLQPQFQLQPQLLQPQQQFKPQANMWIPQEILLLLARQDAELRSLKLELEALKQEKSQISSGLSNTNNNINNNNNTNNSNNKDLQANNINSNVGRGNNGNVENSSSNNVNVNNKNILSSGSSNSNKNTKQHRTSLPDDHLQQQQQLHQQHQRILSYETSKRDRGSLDSFIQFNQQQQQHLQQPKPQQKPQKFFQQQQQQHPRQQKSTKQQLQKQQPAQKQQQPANNNKNIFTDSNNNDNDDDDDDDNVHDYSLPDLTVTQFEVQRTLVSPVFPEMPDFSEWCNNCNDTGIMDTCTQSNLPAATTAAATTVARPNNITDGKGDCEDGNIVYKDIIEKVQKMLVQNKTAKDANVRVDSRASSSSSSSKSPHQDPPIQSNQGMLQRHQQRHPQRQNLMNHRNDDEDEDDDDGSSSSDDDNEEDEDDEEIRIDRKLDFEEMTRRQLKEIGIDVDQIDLAKQTSSTLDISMYLPSVNHKSILQMGRSYTYDDSDDEEIKGLGDTPHHRHHQQQQQIRNRQPPKFLSSSSTPSDVSLQMDSLAMKYLKDEELACLARVNKSSRTKNVPDCSKAMKKALKMGNRASGAKNHNVRKMENEKKKLEEADTTLPNKMLDIESLKELPKLL
ncbi:hypothetical protein HELRODRAFT_191278 [Helobdella robusta]|uniref:STIL N-terminal domain-containing protein n=1 Tax=Helobdella robusta TaxID=6412 RepID=T1FSU2_HELRO|nr:hypothetical protein HELRODRAFT_191278 [Helobdella robusta]ESO07003.1 hypothetical protein HELRODRAFT_191278 [Helobdella robusta]